MFGNASVPSWAPAPFVSQEGRREEATGRRLPPFPTQVAFLLPIARRVCIVSDRQFTPPSPSSNATSASTGMAQLFSHPFKNSRASVEISVVH